MAAKFLEVLVVVACSWLAPEVKGQPPGDDLTLIVDIEEESPSQSFVVNIREGTDLDNLFNSSHQDQLEFGIIPQPDGLDSYFHLDPESGILRTAARIDRELLCPEQADCILTMGISVKDVADMFEIIPIQINILDINDNPPEFIPAMFRLTFSENDGIGSKRDLPVAMDTDSPNFGIQSYRLITSYPEFTLETFPNPVTGYLDVRLVLSDQLDREWKESYEMTVEAVDGGDQTGQLRVEVTVRDENDHSPQFQNSSVSITVPEDHPVDQPLYQMRAVDDDTGDNARVTYSYSPRTANLYAAFFYLNSTSGQVSLLVPLDYEMRKIFHLEIMASDYGPSPRSTQAMLMIHVLDVNDNSPVVTLSSQSGGADIPQIQENLPPGKFVSHVFVFDADDGQNAQVSCDLNEPGFELELIRKDQYKIVTTAVLDREVTPEHVLHLVCQDQGVPSLTTYTPIQVTILDENDNPPVFERTSYVATVPENNARHASLFRVTATDQDAADNARLSFSIVDDQHSVLNYIYITPDGTIHASGVFDYEDTKELVFSVHATDHGTPVQEATVTATLKILDVNDEAPHFLRTDYTFQVEENQDPHSFLGEVTAQDLDTPPFNIFEYSIASTQPGIAQPPTFAINPASGEIMTLRPLDREEQEVYHMTVVATDLDNPRLQGSASVTIQVEDKNDNSPEIFFPPQNNSFRVSNRVPEGYNITGVFALDEDAGENAKLSYQIVSGNEDRVFKIDSESGILSTNSKLQHFEYEQFNIGILVSDKGTPSQLGTITLVITVDDTIPYSQGFAPNSGIVRGQNLTIIIAVAAASGFVIIVLVIAILVLKTRGVHQGCLCQGGLQRCRKVLKSTSPSPASPWHTVTSSPVIQVEATLPVPHGSYPGRDDTCMQVTASTPAYAEQKNLAHSFQYPKDKSKKRESSYQHRSVDSNFPARAANTDKSNTMDKFIEAHLLAVGSEISPPLNPAYQEDQHSLTDQSNTDSGNGNSEAGVCTSAESLPFVPERPDVPCPVHYDNHHHRNGSRPHSRHSHHSQEKTAPSSVISFVPVLEEHRSVLYRQKSMPPPESSKKIQPTSRDVKPDLLQIGNPVQSHRQSCHAHGNQGKPDVPPLHHHDDQPVLPRRKSEELTSSNHVREDRFKAKPKVYQAVVV